MYKITITKQVKSLDTKTTWMSVLELEKLGIAPKVDDNGVKQSGYVDREYEKVEDVQIYCQQVEELDVNKLIVAINS